MNCLRWPFSLSPERKRPAALSSSVLNKAPVEILLCIIDYLPLEAAAAFSLSCMYLKRLLGTQHLLRVSSSTKGTLALLNLLALDLPDQVACSTCNRLHTIQNLRRYNNATYTAISITNRYYFLRTPACTEQDLGAVSWDISRLFGTTAFKMAIKRYHQKPECTELLRIMSSKEARTIHMEDYIQQFKEECRIVQGCLLHRLQSVYVLRKRSSTVPFRINRFSERICPHISFTTSEHVGSGATRCQKCRTEYRIDFKYYDGHGPAMFFTRWKDLGTGPEDEVWKEHLLWSGSQSVAGLRASFISPAPAQTSGRLQNQPRDGDLSSAFEGSDDFRFDSLLTSKNKAKLFRFQKKWSTKIH